MFAWKLRLRFTIWIDFFTYAFLLLMYFFLSVGPLGWRMRKSSLYFTFKGFYLQIGYFTFCLRIFYGIRFLSEITRKKGDFSCPGEKGIISMLERCAPWEGTSGFIFSKSDWLESYFDKEMFYMLIISITSWSFYVIKLRNSVINSS